MCIVLGIQRDPSAVQQHMQPPLETFALSAVRRVQHNVPHLHILDAVFVLVRLPARAQALQGQNAGKQAVLN